MDEKSFREHIQERIIIQEKHDRISKQVILRKDKFVKNLLLQSFYNQLLVRLQKNNFLGWTHDYVTLCHQEIFKFMKNFNRKKHKHYSVNNLCFLSSYQHIRKSIIHCITDTLCDDMGIADVVHVDCSEQSLLVLHNQWEQFKLNHTVDFNTFPAHAKGGIIPVQVDKYFIVVINGLGLSRMENEPTDTIYSQRTFLDNVNVLFDPTQESNANHSCQILLLLSLNDSDANISNLYSYTNATDSFSLQKYQTKLQTRYSFIQASSYFPLPVCSDNQVKEAICKTMLSICQRRFGDLVFEIHDIISDPCTWLYDSKGKKSNVDCLLQEVSYVTENINVPVQFEVGSTVLIHGVEDGSMQMSTIDSSNDKYDSSNGIASSELKDKSIKQTRIQNYISEILNQHFKQANFIISQNHQDDLGQSLGFLSQQRDGFTPEIIVKSFTNFMTNQRGSPRPYCKCDNIMSMYTHINKDDILNKSVTTDESNIIVEYNKRFDMVGMRTEEGKLVYRSSLFDKMKIIMEYIQTKIKQEVRLVEKRLEAKIIKLMSDKKHKKKSKHEKNNIVTPFLPRSGIKRKQKYKEPEFDKRIKSNPSKKIYNHIRLECENKKKGGIRGRWRISYFDSKGYRKIKRITLEKTFKQISETAITLYKFTEGDVQQSKQEIDFEKIKQLRLQ